MRKFVIACAIAIASGFACAADFDVSTVRDVSLDKSGVRIGTTVAGLNANVTNMQDTYNRWAVGKDFQLTKVGPVALGASVAGVYQNTMIAGKDDGFGASVGAKASVDLTKNISVVAGVERFIGTHRVKEFDGNVATVGLKISL